MKLPVGVLIKPIVAGLSTPARLPRLVIAAIPAVVIARSTSEIHKWPVVTMVIISPCLHRM
ncbi:MAG: hypothetical protein CFE47_11730 [Pseudomonas sp. PGPPP1]|nr:MAG: hypothetical protein CFE47_11730 [Pseudomonas sp. PGPPP1]